MKPQTPVLHDDFDEPRAGVEEVEKTSEDNLWFLPGPIDEAPGDLPAGPQAEPRNTAVLDDWRKAEAGQAGRLARVAGRLGDDAEPFADRAGGWLDVNRPGFAGG
jgi:hypothetical protein